MRSRVHQWWVAVLLACVLALPTTAALAAHLAPASPPHPLIFTECQYTTETDNVQVKGGRNPFWDDLGNEWDVYYDITRDSHDGVPCDMRIVMRIFNPPTDGSWKGTAAVYAFVDGNYNSSATGQVSGSCTYQYHFVWRGPWFGANPGSSYHIFIDEFNGSSRFVRAATDFSL